MKMKKVLAMVLAGAMSMSMLAGCASSSGSSESASSESTEASEGGSEVFKIGGIGPTTGGAAIYGQAVQNAMELAAEEINAAGGMNGYQVEIRFEDDEHDAEKSVNAYNTLKDWGMQILEGTVTSKPCVAVAAETKNDNMFQITPSGSAEDCIANDNAYAVCFSDPNQGRASAQYIGEHNLATKVAVIYDSSDVYSTGIYETFAAEAANQSFELVATEAFTADSNKDFSTQVQKAKDAGADLIFLPIYYTEASLILDQASKISYDVTFFGCDGMDGILSLENFDTALAEGLILLTPFVADAEDEATKTFVEKYQEKYGDVPNQFAADAYDGLYAIKAAIEEESITPDMSVSDICEAMKSGFSKINIQGLTGGESGISWEANGGPSKEPKAMVIENGAYTAM